MNGILILIKIYQIKNNLGLYELIKKYQNICIYMYA